MAGYVNPIEPMSQLNLDIGKPSAQNPQKMKTIDPEAGNKFKEKYLSEIEANRVLREMEKNKAIDKARDFVKHGKAAFGPSGGGGGGGGGGGMPKLNRDITKNMKKGGKVSSASSRADGCATKGKTKGRMV
jgi:hypothetical protein